MDCLFIKEDFRRGGIGKKMLEKILEEARHSRCNEVQWQTPIWNQLGIGFYQKIGATVVEKTRLYLGV
ncbi:MAG: GNAT family N-acetyltransferase [Cyclobacteriaceae bacterium]